MQGTQDPGISQDEDAASRSPRLREYTQARPPEGCLSFAMGNGQVTLMNCFIVREADKGGDKKKSKKP